MGFGPPDEVTPGKALGVSSRVWGTPFVRFGST
jgi:hypothetical protein